jgi:hypothetical protein
MDDYFQYLFFLFIIISLLSSFFKKKKPESKPENSIPGPPAKPQRSSQQEDYDIMKEIEKMFKTQSPQPEKQPENIPTKEKKYKPSEHTEDPEWHEEDPEWHTEDPSEHRLENWDDRRKKAEAKSRKTLNEKILREAKMFEENLARKSQVVEVRMDLIKKLKQPSTLREYVIISEILGKPKAFQE